MTVPEEVVRVLRMRPVWLRVLLAGGVRERGMVLEGVGERGVLLVCGCVSRVRVRGASEGVNLRKCACQRRVPLPWACVCPIHSHTSQTLLVAMVTSWGREQACFDRVSRHEESLESQRCASMLAAKKSFVPCVTE